jgi:hypothetical protein
MVVVAEPVLAEIRGDPGTYHLLVRNLTARPTTGVVEVTAPPPLQVSAPRELALPAHGEVKVPVQVDGQDQLTRNAEMAAKIITPLASWDLVRGVMPVVPNGDFEQDGAGDMRPDWWMGRKLADEWDPEHIGLSTDAASGRYCLRVDASDNPQGFVRGYSVMGAVKPNTRYHVNGWIKRADATGQVAIQFSGFGWQGLQTAEVGRWVRLELDCTSADNAREMVVQCANRSRGPAWFDGIEVRETP